MPEMVRVNLRIVRTDIIQRIEHSEDVETILNSFLGEVINGIIPAYYLNKTSSTIALRHIRITCVPDAISTTNKCLERDIGNQFTQSTLKEIILNNRLSNGTRSYTYQAIPRIFIQEAHCNIESCTSPAFHTIGVGQRVARLLRNIDHVDSPETGGEK